MSSSPPRRLPLVAVLLLLLVAAGGGMWWSARPGYSALPAVLYGAREVPPPPPPPALDPDRSLTVAVLGDWGQSSDAQRAVGREMARVHGEHPFDLVLTVGDNFYPNGVASTEDEMWRTHFREPFVEAGLDAPFYPALGNHDHEGNWQAQVEYSSLDSSWRMPATFYSLVERVDGETTAELFVLDTEPIRLKDRVAAGQVRWLADKLERSTADWKIVVGHHPLVSNGPNGGSSVLRRRIQGLLETHRVDLYAAGHDHHLELVSRDGSFPQVISGSGSAPRSATWRDDTLFASCEPGFVWLQIEADRLLVHFQTAAGGHRFSYELH